MKIELVMDEPYAFTVWRFGNWLHTYDHETKQHSWEWWPEGSAPDHKYPTFDPGAVTEFLKLTEGMA